MDKPSADARKQKEIEALLTRVPVVADACTLDLLVFL